MIQTLAQITHIHKSRCGNVAYIFCRPEQHFSFQEGQFMMIESIFGSDKLNGKPLKKPYSIATTNRDLQENNTIGFIVKKVSEGRMSDYLVTQLAVGDTIKLTGALGHMVDHHQAGNYLLMSIGSGLSPIYSLYNHLIDTSHFDRLVNIFGERYRDNVIDEVEQSFSLQSDRVKNLCYLSKEKNLTKHRRLGYIQDGIHEAIEFLGINENLHVFLCGKPEMVNDVIHILISAGLDKSQIAFEKY